MGTKTTTTSFSLEVNFWIIKARIHKEIKKEKRDTEPRQKPKKPR